MKNMHVIKWNMCSPSLNAEVKMIDVGRCSRVEDKGMGANILVL